MANIYRGVALLGVAVCLSVSGGCSTAGIDPYEKSNRFFYTFNDNLDHYAFKPASDAYVKVTPKPVRDSLSNALDNLGYFNVILNDFLQGKIAQGLSDSGRMAANSTAGLGGLFDIATPLNMPSHDNDFGITLAKWGVQQGPYLVLPLFGPTTTRDAPGIVVGIAADPVTWINPPWGATIPLGILTLVDGRSRADQEFRFRNQAAIDPYVFTRDGYLQYRQGQINEGSPAPSRSLYDEDFGPATAPATQPGK